MQTYKSTSLGFSISYPDGWHNVPAPWAKQFMGLAKTTSKKFNEYLTAGSPPFLIAHDLYGQPGHAVSALKCQAYTAATIASTGGINAFLSSIVDRMNEAFPDFKLHEFSSEYVVAGVIGGRLTASMSVSNSDGESFLGLSELLFLPTNRYAFAIGLTATADMKFRPEDALSDIKRSIRLGSGA